MTVIYLTATNKPATTPQKMQHPWFKALLLLLCLQTQAAKAEAISCLDLQVVGVCFWLVCSLYECHTEESVKIGHFNPDVDMRVTNPQGVERVEDPARTDTHNRNHNNLIYHEARASGDVLAGLIYCPSQATALLPYFLSELDADQWRWGILEQFMPPSWIPGLREIGHWPLNTWHNLYPRTGWTTQSSVPKSAASVAQRVGDIITRTAQLHIYLPLTGEADTADKRVWEPGELVENTNREGYFQLLSPVFEPGCRVFGENDILKPVDWGGGKVATDGAYSYTLWRPYKCCEIKGAFIGSVDFVPYPTPL